MNSREKAVQSDADHRASEYDVESVRQEWVGRVVASSKGRYPVEFDSIRRFCHMSRDSNPLFLDADVAAAGPYGAVIVPLPQIPYFAGNGPWPRRTTRNVSSGPRFTYGVPTPGKLGINLDTSWKYLSPVRVADRLHAETTITDIYCKPIRLDPMAVWIVTRTDIWNQHDVLVAQGANTVLAHRSPSQVKEDIR